MTDIHPIKDFLAIPLVLSREEWAVAVLLAIILVLLLSWAVFRVRGRVLDTPDVIPVAAYRADFLARLAAVSLEDSDAAFRIHAAAREYVDLVRARLRARTRTGREMTRLIPEERVRRFEEMYTASEYASDPLDYEGLRRFRRLAEEIVLGIE